MGQRSSRNVDAEQPESVAVGKSNSCAQPKPSDKKEVELDPTLSSSCPSEERPLSKLNSSGAKEVHQDGHASGQVDNKPKGSTKTNCPKKVKASKTSFVSGGAHKRATGNKKSFWKRLFARNNVSPEEHQRNDKIQSPKEEDQDEKNGRPQEQIRAGAQETKNHFIAQTENINSYYKRGDKLGQGQFGSVFEGQRLSDGLQVAIKYVPKTNTLEYLRVPGYKDPLPAEVALMIMMQKRCNYPQILKLHEWYDEPQGYTLVLERPADFEDMSVYLKRFGGRIDENLARVIMWQVVQAAILCSLQKVFHRDIKPQNLLINKTTLDVKLIDFGCGTKLRKGPYKKIMGTILYLPPEVFIKQKCRGEPTTVWSLGILLFSLVTGRFPFAHELNTMYIGEWTECGLSKDLCDLISSCLQFRPKDRIRLGQIHQCPWFTVPAVC